MNLPNFQDQIPIWTSVIHSMYRETLLYFLILAVFHKLLFLNEQMYIKHLNQDGKYINFIIVIMKSWFDNFVHCTKTKIKKYINHVFMIRILSTSFWWQMTEAHAYYF